MSRSKVMLVLVAVTAAGAFGALACEKPENPVAWIKVVEVDGGEPHPSCVKGCGVPGWAEGNGWEPSIHLRTCQEIATTLDAGADPAVDVYSYYCEGAHIEE